MSEIYSFSKLEKYTKCGEYFRRYYLDTSVPRPITDTASTVAGTLCHAALEEFYGPEVDRKIPPVDLLGYHWGCKLQVLCMHDVPTATQNLASLKSKLQAIQTDWAQLTLLASEDYKGPGAIRTASGYVSKKPQETSGWKAMANQLKLPSRMAEVDDLAKRLQPNPWSVVSLAETFCLSYQLLNDYRDPDEFSVVMELEMPITNRDTLANLVVLPETGALFTGFIDVVHYTRNGGLAISDHKTSKGEFSYAKVLHHEQLLCYGWSYTDLTGQQPAYIGINGLRSHTLTLAPFDMALATRAIQRQELAIKGIEAGVFIPHSPVSYNSPCCNEYSKTECPYLQYCHPTFKH